jgi:VanZ family protein
MKKVLKWSLVIGWMAVIFIYSNQPAVISNEKSRFVIAVFKYLGLNLDSLLGGLSDFIVRKLGHFTEYAILYLVLYNAMKESFKSKTALIISLVILFFYASSDEIHQYFVPGRACRVQDVLIDTCGGTFPMAIIYFKKSKNKGIKKGNGN